MQEGVYGAEDVEDRGCEGSRGAVWGRGSGGRRVGRFDGIENAEGGRDGSEEVIRVSDSANVRGWQAAEAGRSSSACVVHGGVPR